MALDQLLEDDGHLELGEGGAEAAANAAAEGDPGVGAGRGLEEALGEEAVRLGVDLGIAVDEVDAGGDRGAGGQLVAADLDRLGQLADHQHDHRAQPQRLLDRRRQVGLVATGQGLGSQTLELLGVADQALHRPGERGRGGLVAGDQQGQQLVADLGVAHRAAVLVAGGDQHREDVVALGEVLGQAALGDLGVDQLVDPLDAAAEGGDVADPLRSDQEDRSEEPRVGGEVEEAAQSRPQRVHPCPVVDAEDSLEDDLQRYRLHPRSQLVGGAGRPALDLPHGDLGHRLAVALHPLAVERRQQQLALADVRLLVEDQDRVLAEDRAQDLVALAGVEDARIAGEDLLDERRVGHHHPGPFVGDPDREHVAEAGPALLQHPLRLARPDRRLQRPRHSRARREAGNRRTCSTLRRRLHRPI